METTDTFKVTAGTREIPSGDIAPEWVMYMPAGKNEINASLNGKPATLIVNVAEKDAVLLQASLEALLEAGGPEPYVGFDHTPGPAGFWPKAFMWVNSDKPGIYVKAEWTDKGKSSVAGREYRYFSPTFSYDKKTQSIAGLPDKGEIGSLVNNPAFRDIKAVAASNQNQDDTDMDDKIKALEAELAKANETIASYVKTMDSMKKDKAKCSVTAAVKEGKIAPQDTATQDKWVDMILASESAETLLNALPVVHKVEAGRFTDDVRQKVEAKDKTVDGFAIQKRADDLVKASGLPYHVAWCQASNEAGEIISNAKPTS